MFLVRVLSIAALLFFPFSRAFAYPEGTILPLPEFVKAKRFQLPGTELKEDTKLVVFYYSASWCAPCKKVGDALSQSYEAIISNAKGLEFVTYSVDLTPRARADYLRDTAYEWPAISPQVIDKEPWLTTIPGGTPQFQAFRMQDRTLVALTDPDDANTVLQVALRYLSENP
ncbi:MAG: thioredoxin-like domain-containing protein [Verrucomicrobiota bacterium]